MTGRTFQASKPGFAVRIDWELYDMAADRTQRRGLAASHPERVTELATAHQRWAASHQVVPWETREHKRP